MRDKKPGLRMWLWRKTAIGLLVVALTGVIGSIWLSGPTLWLAVAAVTLAMLIAAWLQGDQLARRFAAVAGAVRALGQGDFTLTVPQPLGGSAEEHELADALAMLAGNVGERLASLSGSRDELMAVLGHMQNAVLLIDSKDRLLLLNPSAQKLLGIAEQAGQTVSDLPSLALQQTVRTARAAGETQRLRLDLTRPQPVVLEVTARPLERAGERQVLLILRDITEARRLDDMRRDFVANVSHELKTPVTAVQGFAETLLAGALNDPDEARRFVEIMKREADRLADLVRDLLMLARLEGDPHTVQPRPAPLADLLTAGVERLQLAAAAAQTTLELDMSEVPPDTHVLADPERIEQVLVNLIDNGIRHTPEGGRVLVKAAIVGSEAVVHVQDTGTGIPPDLLPRIFERFYRIDRGRSRRAGGTGLGLAIVKHIVDLHGGRAWAESEAGRGATISFTLPLVHDE